MGFVRRRRRRQKKKQVAETRETEVPTSSFSDIAFLLIIYFLVATTLVTTKGLVTDMPAGQKSESADMEEVPSIMLMNEAIRFNGERVTIDLLRRELQKLDLSAQPAERRVVMVEAAGSQKYELFYQVIAAVQKAGGVIASVRSDEEEKS